MRSATRTIIRDVIALRPASLRTLLTAAACALLALPAARVSAEDFFIDDGDVPALIAAIEAANANGEADTIHLAADGTYTLTAPYSGLTGLPSITTEIAINGNGAAIQRDAVAPNFRILFVASTGDLTLDNVTITGGRSPFGGGILNNSGTLTVVNSTVSGNTADFDGGGIYNWGTLTVTDSMVSGNSVNPWGSGGGGIYNGGTLVITDSMISGNSADHSGGGGGGIFNSSNGVVTLTNSTATGNTAGSRGGGIYNNSFYGTVTLTNSTISDNAAYYAGGGGIYNAGTLTVTDSTIRGNVASSYGGGIDNWGPTVSVTNSTINDNAADSGGGIRNFAGTLTLINSTVSGNTAGLVGGGIINYNSGVLTVDNSTISGNSAPPWGGGGGGIRNDGTLSMTNSVVAYNGSGGDIVGPYTDAGHNIVEDGSGITHFDSFAADPMLGPLADNGGPTWTHALLPGSPAIDAGDCAGGAVTEDQRGVPRPQGAACDIGAFELESEDCYADCNGDGEVNTIDFICFLNHFTAGDPAADCNGDGEVNTLDFICFLNAFVAGCP